MAWARIDDGWWCHPKVLGLSLEARGLWATTLSWSCAHRTDEIQPALVRMVGGSDAMAEELVDAGLWHEAEEGWRFHDWAEYQDQSLSEKRAEAGAKGGKRSGETRRNEANAKQGRSKTKQEQRSKDEANSEAGTRPGPSQPDPKPVGPRRRVQRPTDWKPNSKHAELASEMGVSLEAELAQFCDFHDSKGSTFKDWDAALRTWLRNAKKYAGKGGTLQATSVGGDAYAAMGDRP